MPAVPAYFSTGSLPSIIFTLLCAKYSFVSALIISARLSYSRRSLRGLCFQRVLSQDRHGNSCVRVTRHGIGQLVRIDLPPTDRFTGCGARQPARIGTSIGHLQEKVLSRFLDPEHFLNLGLRLQHEILRTAAAPKHDAAAAAPAL